MVLTSGGGLLPAPTSGGTTMEQYAGIDVSLDSASVCIVDAQGKIVKEAKVACEPEALIAWLAAHGTPMARIGLEARPLRQKRHTPEEIVSKLRQVDVLVSQGTPVADAIRAIGVT